MELALVVEPYACCDLRLRNAPSEERSREADAPMGHVRVRRQPHLIAKGTTEAELVESRVRGQLVECNRLREVRVEQLAPVSPRWPTRYADARGLDAQS
jgi:hypothetical protein